MPSAKDASSRTATALSPAVHISKPEDIPDPRSLQREPMRFLVDGLIPRDGVTIIAGEYSVGKSWLALVLASELRRGRTFIGREVMHCAEVIYFDRENPLSVIQERLDVVYRDGEAAHSHWGLWNDAEPPLLEDSLLLAFAKPGTVLIFDTLVRFHRADENSPTQMAEVMACLRRMQSRGAAVIALHHRPKKLEAGGYRGTAEIAAGADVLFSLSKEEGNLVLRAVKARVEVDQVVTFRADWDQARLVPTELNSVLEKRALVEEIRDYIRRSPGISQSGIAKSINATLVKPSSRWRIQRVLDQHEGSLWRAERGPTGTRTSYFDLFSTDKKPLLNDDPKISGQQVAGDRPAEPATDAPAGLSAIDSITSTQAAGAAESRQQVLPRRPAGLLSPYKGGQPAGGLVGSDYSRGRNGNAGEGGLA